MPGRVQLVMGAAGAGKTSYCRAIQQHCETERRIVHMVNLDPATVTESETSGINYAIDIRDLVTVEDMMEHISLGPNGALVHCLEYLIENLDWFDESLGDYDSDYLVIDCPGQIELYTHLPVMPRLVDLLQQRGYVICAVFCVDASAAADPARFLSSALAALSCMVHVKVSHINVLTKTDLLPSKRFIQTLCDSEPSDLLAQLSEEAPPRFRLLNDAVAKLLEDFNMVGFLPMSITRPKSIACVLAAADHALQYGEDEEPKDPKEREADDADD